MTNKTYNIYTIQQIADIVTTENIDRFMADFYKVMDYFTKVKEHMPAEQFKDIRMPSFEWTDDGEDNFDVKVNGQLI